MTSQITLNIHKLDRAVRAQIEAGLLKSLERMKSHAEDLLTRQTHPSLPGEAPVSQSGTLLNSLEVSATSGPRGVQGVLSARADHALYLELGTETMAARPFLRRVLEDNETQIIKDMADESS